MRYVSIDIETTGLNPDENQIIEFGAVVADTEDTDTPVEDLPSFHCYVVHDSYNVSEYVLGMHADSGIWKRLQKRDDAYTYLKPEEVEHEFYKFLVANGFGTKDYLWITAAGKNFASFDLQFIKALPNWGKKVKIRHRVLDPAPMYLLPTDSRTPDLSTCLERAGIEDTDIAHTAVEDAQDVVRVINHYFDNNVPTHIKS